ncbi:mitochondrial large subunit ribosomal protein-domain-containing protein [Biscogniauxia sp. FL1348]|nr:mitochondrial large subunit ribosomal protein-domain-containing protein [Biscogniauxia sp. FL1348]
MLSRTSRPLTRASAPLSTLSTLSSRIILPASARNITTSEPATDAPLHAPSGQPSSEASEFVAPSEPPPQPTLPYYVGRNNLRNFGVYHKVKSGGNFKITLLKKGEGNLQALKRDIRDALGLPETDVSVNNVTRHIVIRGHRREQVLTFLHTMGF